jgi:N-acetylmuramoyl-L-alanine amidase
MTAVEFAGQLSDEDVVAATVWAEGRGLKLLGRVAIACVIRNRAIRRNQTPKQVCLARLQFSCWWKAGGAANYSALMRLLEELEVTSDPDWPECEWIAHGVLSGVCRDVTKGADHYLTTRLLASHDRPSWVNAMTCTGVIEAHTFYRS